MKTYIVRIKGYEGHKEFTNKHKLRGWLMNYLNKQNIHNMDINVVE